MNLHQVSIRFITAEDARPIRGVVLRPGQPAAASVYPGDDDPASFHLGAFLEDRLVAVASFLPEPGPVHGSDRGWRLRGMATVDDVRGCGIGGLMLARGIRETTDRRGTTLWCYGRAQARPFYERHGMRVIGDEFELPNTGPLFLFVMDLGSGSIDSPDLEITG